MSSFIVTYHININNFEVSVDYDAKKEEVLFVVKGESTYSCIAGTTENQDNYQRLQNIFEKAIPKKEQEIIKNISALENNLEQARERAEMPFLHESELEEKIEEFQKLEEKLSGLSAKKFKENKLVAWEENERQVMEKILNKYGFEREDKQAKYSHQTVDEYKKFQDEKKIISALKASRNIPKEEISAEKIRRLKEKLNLMEKENQNLEKQKNSPYKSFFYSVPEKQIFVQSQLDEKNIPYRETENGFEAQECYIDEIRKIEKEFKPTGSIREKIRDDVDRLLMQSASVDELHQP